MRTHWLRALRPSGGSAGRCERPCMSAGRHAWLHSGEPAAVRGCAWLAGVLVRCLPGRGGPPGALTSAGGPSRVAGLAGLSRVFWMHRSAGLLAEVSGRLAGAAFMIGGLLL